MHVCVLYVLIKISHPFNQSILSCHFVCLIFCTSVAFIYVYVVVTFLQMDLCLHCLYQQQEDIGRGTSHSQKQGLYHQNDCVVLNILHAVLLT